MKEDIEKVAFNKFYVDFVSHHKGDTLNPYIKDILSQGNLKEFLQYIYDGNAPFIKVIKIGGGLLSGSLGDGQHKLDSEVARENADILYKTELGEIYSFPKNVHHDVSFLNCLSSFLDQSNRLSDVSDEFLDELNLNSPVRCLAAVSELEKQAPFMFNKLAELIIQLMAHYNYGFFNINKEYLVKNLGTNKIPELNTTNNNLDFGWLVSHYPIEYPDSGLDTHTSCVDKIFENSKEIVESDAFEEECQRFNRIANAYLERINEKIEGLLVK